jgi:uncharacterized protein with PIN domain
MSNLGDAWGSERVAIPARLNLGDCFTYAAAKAAEAPLLHEDEDVRQARKRTEGWGVLMYPF